MGSRILIIDDSPLARAIMADMLDLLGHQVVGEAETGQAGIASFRTSKPDVTMLDISLPDMDGIAVLAQLRAIDPASKVVIVSGNKQERIQEQAARYKVPLIAKPYTMEDLKQALGSSGTPA